MPRFLVVFLDGVTHGSREVDAFDNIEASNKVKEEIPGCKIEQVTMLEGDQCE